VIEILTGQQEWLPTLVVGSKQITQSQFSLSGDVGPPGSGGKGRQKGGGGLGAFGGGAEDPVPGRLAAQHIEYEIRVPGSPLRVERRSLFDWVDPAARSSTAAMSPDAVQTPADAAVQVFHETALMVLGGGVSDEFVEHAVLGFLIERGSLLATTLRNPAAGWEAVSRTLRRTDASLEPRLLELAAARLLFRAPDLPVFISRPNILTLHRGLRTGTGGELNRWEAYDIVANDVEAIPGAISPRLARLQQGVVDSNAESILAGSGSGDPGVSEIMSAGRTTADQWTVVTRATDIPTTVRLGAHARARLTAALGRGSIAILPSRTTDLPAHGTGWWEVDPRTGRVLAVDSRGWGGQLGTEYVVTLQNVFIFLMEMAAGFYCFFKAAQGTATESLAGTICSFASCAAGVVFIHLSFFKVAVSGFIAPTLGLGFIGCSILFPPPKGT
jgi:hypothetical protein